jgi:hypothetical protein
LSVEVVYRVRWDDLDRYQALMYDLPDAPSELTTFNGVSKASWWEPPPVYSDSPRLEEPDLWHLSGCAAIVMLPAVAEELAEYLHPVGELLRLRRSGSDEGFVALNILRDVDCLNPDAYRIDDLEIYTDFIEHRLPEGGLFKVPQVDDVEIFCLERDDDGETFRDAIDRLSLRGLRFDPVWSTDGTVGPVNLLALF